MHRRLPFFMPKPREATPVATWQRDVECGEVVVHAAWPTTTVRWAKRLAKRSKAQDTPKNTKDTPEKPQDTAGIPFDTTNESRVTTKSAVFDAREGTGEIARLPCGSAPPGRWQGAPCPDAPAAPVPPACRWAGSSPSAPCCLYNRRCSSRVGANRTLTIARSRAAADPPQGLAGPCTHRWKLAGQRARRPTRSPGGDQ